MTDESDRSLRDERAEAQRIVLANQVREAAAQAALENRLQFWDRLGVDVRTETGEENLRRAFAYLLKAEERARTMPKRVLGWLTFVISLASILIEAISKYLEWRK